MKRKGNIIAGILNLVLFAALIAGVKKYDVAMIGPDATCVGFSHLNQKFAELTGVNMTIYKITDYLGYLALAVVAVFAVVGLVQLIKRKSLAKVDREIFALGGLYIIVLGLYAAFEKVIINYRPILMPDGNGPEASFPSSHTMLTITVMGSTILVLKHFIEKDGLRKVLQVLCWLVLLATVAGRLVCGVHWLTDIIGGLLLSLGLLNLFTAVIKTQGEMPVLDTSGYSPKH